MVLCLELIQETFAPVAVPATEKLSVAVTDAHGQPVTGKMVDN